MRWRQEALGVLGPLIAITLSVRFAAEDGASWFSVIYLALAVGYTVGYFWSAWRRFANRSAMPS